MRFVHPTLILGASLLVGSWFNSMGGMFGVSVSLSPIWAMMAAIKTYIVSLAMIFVMALIIDGLAPTFGATRGRVQALKVSTYSATASFRIAA